MLSIRPILTALFATATLCSCNSQKSLPSATTVSTAADEVYEVVIRDLVSPNGPSKINQLVFDEDVLSDFTTSENVEGCKKTVEKQLSHPHATPMFNTLADKIYRAFHYPSDDGTLQASTISDTAEKMCAKRRPLSTTFRTDLPRVFIDPNSVYFEGEPAPRNALKNFHQSFPEASGIISLSSVGFDPALREGTVSVAYDCVFLCGTSWRYIVKNISGKWVVTRKWILWVS